MNPGMLFDEVLESHEFRPSDRFVGWFGHVVKSTFFVSDNANLSDIYGEGQVRLILEYNLE